MATYYNPRIVTNGLVLCLDAANTKSYPSTGTTWTDLSGNGNNGTLLNGPTFSSANGGSIVYDGTNDGVRVTLPSTTSSYNTFTYNAWIRIGSSGTGFIYRTIIDQDNDTLFFGTLVLGTPNSHTLVSYDPTWSTNYTLNINQWYNVALSHINGQPLLFYVNGVLVSTSPNATTNHTTTYFGIGSGFPDANTTNESWIGNIAQASIYNRALSAAEIQQNFNALRGRYGL